MMLGGREEGVVDDGQQDGHADRDGDDDLHARDDLSRDGRVDLEARGRAEVRVGEGRAVAGRPHLNAGCARIRNRRQARAFPPRCFRAESGQTHKYRSARTVPEPSSPLVSSCEAQNVETASESLTEAV